MAQQTAMQQMYEELMAHEYTIVTEWANGQMCMQLYGVCSESYFRPQTGWEKGNQQD